MRYLLLAVVLVVASVMLPMVVMPDRPTGQPVEPVEVAALPGDTETAPTPTPDAVAVSGPAAAAAEAPVVETVNASSMPGMALGGLALNAASSLPFASLAHMFDGKSGASSDEASPSMFGLVSHFMPGQAEAMAETETVALADLPEPAPAAAAPEMAMPAETAMPAGDALASEPDLPVTPIGAAPEVASDPLAPVDIEYGMLRLDPVGEPIVLAVLGDDADTAEQAAPVPGIGDAGDLAAAKAAAVEGETAAVDPAAVDPAEDTAMPEVAEEAPAGDSKDDLGRLKVTAAILNMRAGPSSSHAVVTGLSQGAVTEVTGQARNGWVPVRVPGTGQTGWVFSRYMAPVEGA